VEVLLSGKTISLLLQATVVLLQTVLLLTAGTCQVVIRLLGTRVVHNYCDIHVFSVNFCFWVASFLGLKFEIGMGLNFCFDSSFCKMMCRAILVAHHTWKMNYCYYYYYCEKSNSLLS